MNLALNNLQRLICHKPKQSTNHRPFWVRVDLGVMAMKGYSIFPKIP